MGWKVNGRMAAPVFAVVAAATIACLSLDAALGEDTLDPSHAVSGQAGNEKAPAPVPQQQESESTPPATPIAPIGLLSPTILITQTVAPTVTVPVSDTSSNATVVPEDEDNSLPPAASPSATPPAIEASDDTNADDGAEVAAPQTGTPPVTVEAIDTAAQEGDAGEGQPLRGAIVSNRTNHTARFFLEGEVYRVAPASSAGVDLPRITAVLSLCSCDALTPEAQEGCYWDPYLLQRDGFYEIFDESTIEGLPSLMLRDADTPPENQVWLHNRTGQRESVVFRDTVYELAPASVLEFDVEPGAPVILYVRSCARLGEQEVCEWAPQSLDPGAYYAVVEVSMPGGIPGSRIVTVDLRPVVDGSGQAIAAPAEIVCQLRVPAVNVRNGPGLQYQIVGKVREGTDEPARVTITGRSADRQWFVVAESVSPSGWVTSNPDFMTCRGNTDDLPLAEFAGVPPAPGPEPAPAAVVRQPQPTATILVENEIQEEPTVDASEVITASVEPQTTGIPEGLSLLVVNNGFQFPIRFTVDQHYRPVEGSSEYDLESGDSTQIIVFPGNVAFTASSPWNALSGNADLDIEADQSITLWLRFEPDPDGSSNWELAWQ